jgi:hypothetical protein
VADFAIFLGDYRLSPTGVVMSPGDWPQKARYSEFAECESEGLLSWAEASWPPAWFFILGLTSIVPFGQH